jgi:hypothetical protein
MISRDLISDGRGASKASLMGYRELPEVTTWI